MCRCSMLCMRGMKSYWAVCTQFSQTILTTLTLWPMQGPGTMGIALRCLQVHWATIVRQCMVQSASRACFKELCRGFCTLVITFVKSSPTKRTHQELSHPYIPRFEELLVFFILSSKQPTFLALSWTSEVTDYHTKQVYDGQMCAMSPSNWYSPITRLKCPVSARHNNKQCYFW